MVLVTNEKTSQSPLGGLVFRPTMADEPRVALHRALVHDLVPECDLKAHLVRGRGPLLHGVRHSAASE